MGPAVDDEHAAGRRWSGEIDIVGVHRNRVRVVGEYRETTRPMPASVLEELRTFRIPAPLTTSALTASKPEPYILLFARAGFDPALVEAANTDDSISLITADDLVATLTADASTGRDEPERHTVRRV